MSEAGEKKITIIVSIFIVHFIINLILYLSNGFNLDHTEDFYSVYSSVVIIGYGLVALIFLFLISSRFGIRTYLGKVWFLFTLGILSFVFGDMIFSYYDIFLKTESPFPSIADVVYLIGYPLIFIAIFTQIKSLNVKLPKNEIIVISAIQIFIALLVVMFLMIPMISTEITHEFTIEMLLISLAYVLFDLPLFLGALLLIFKYKGGQFSKVWLLVAIALIVMSFGDWLFAYYTWNGISLAWGIYDLFFIALYQILIIVCIFLGKMVKQ